MKHVESPKRNKLQTEPVDSFGMLMKEFQNTNRNRKGALLDCTVEEGRKYYLRDLARWKEALQKALVLDSNMLFLLFKILESQESEMLFEECKTHLDQTLDLQDLADAFLAIGFNIRKNTVKDSDENLNIVFHAVLRTEETPARLILVYLLYSVSQM